MFVQVIHGKLADATALQAVEARWISELSPGATGWLSSTSGSTADGEAVVFVCFESVEAARRNSDRPEQGQWWAEAEECFDGPPTFYDVDDAMVARRGVVPDAGFVQVLLGQVSDAAKDRELMRNVEAMEGDWRPDLLGGVVGVGNDGRFAQAFYFSSEAEARVGEQSEIPGEVAAALAEEQSLITDIRYFDLTEPTIYTAK